MKNSKKVLMNITLLEEFRRKDEGSYLDCFMPLVCACLLEDENEQIDTNKLHTIFSKNFVTNIPKYAMKAILKRAKQKGYLLQHGSNWSKNMPLIQKTHNKFLKLSKKIEVAQDKMIKAFQEFAKTNYQKNVTETEFLDAFTHYMQKHFMDYLKLDVTPQSENKDQTQTMEYLLGVFLKEQWLEKKEVPEFIQTNIQGFYLANYIGYFDSNLHERLKAFKVYIDTPILMGLLGWNGKTTSKYYSDLIEALKKQHVSFHVFESTIDEVKGVHQGYIRAIKTENWESFNRSTLRYIKNNLVTIESIERDIVILENKIQQTFGLKISPSPERVHAYQMDEDKFRDKLVHGGYDAFKANTDKDVDYVSSIHRLREGKFIDHNSQSVPVYFTDNDLLIGTSIDFFRNEDDEHSSTIPHCISDVFLSSLLLLRSPDDIIGISKRKIIAEAFATIHTDNEFWEKIYNKVDVLAKDKELSEEDYCIFRYSTELRAYVADQKVLQNINLDDIDAEKIHNLLQNFKANLTKEKDKALREVELENSHLKESYQNLLKTNSSLDKNNKDLSNKVINTLDGRFVIKHFAKIAALGVSLLFFAFISAATYLDKFSSNYPSYASLFKYSGYTVWVIVTYFCLNIKVVKQWVEDKVENKIFEYFLTKSRTKNT